MDAVQLGYMEVTTPTGEIWHRPISCPTHVQTPEECWALWHELQGVSLDSVEAHDGDNVGSAHDVGEIDLTLVDDLHGACDPEAVRLIHLQQSWNEDVSRGDPRINPSKHMRVRRLLDPFWDVW